MADSDYPTRANVADMLEAFRLEYRSHVAGLIGQLDNLASDVAALLERVDELEGEDMPDRTEALEGDDLAGPKLEPITVKAREFPWPPAIGLDRADEAEIAAELARADEDRAAYDELDSTPDQCPGGC